MKLKLYHDQRDYTMLRKNLSGFEGGSISLSEDKMMEESLKIQIKNIQTHIKHEKERIEKCRSPIAIQHDAACSIQSAWRGFSVRKKIKSAVASQLDDNIKNTSSVETDDNNCSVNATNNENVDVNGNSNTEVKNTD